MMVIVTGQGPSSERRFGLMLTAALLLFGVYGVIARGSTAFVLLIVAGLIFGVLALAAPRSLSALTRSWLFLSNWLGKLVSPVVLGIVFFGLLTPIALITRLFGRDELRLARAKSDSYWIDRASKAITPDSFRDQF